MNELQKNEQLTASPKTFLDWSWSKDGKVYISDSEDLEVNLFRFKKAIELGAKYVCLYYRLNEK